MPSPTLANMRADRARLYREYVNASYRGYMNASTRRGFSSTPTANSSKANRLYAELRSLNARIERREEANRARSAARRARETRLARKTLRHWFRRAHRAPSAGAPWNTGGPSYHRVAVPAASPVLQRLWAKVEEIKALNKELKKQNDPVAIIMISGQMKNLFNSMNRNAARASNGSGAARAMNAAQKILFNANLLSIRRK